MSHSYFLTSGEASDPILRHLGSVTSGSVAVDGFFLISGFLIVKSYQSSRTALEYLTKRILRIHPAYIVCYGLCIVAVASLLGADLSSIPIAKSLLYMLLLKVPPDIGVDLNGSMWTIAFEFRCYLFVMLVGLLGVLNNRKNFLLLTLLLIDATFIFQSIDIGSSQLVLGRIWQNIRLVTIFSCGGCYWLYRDKIIFRGKIAIISTVCLVLLLPHERLNQQAIMIFGGYVLFWFSFNPAVNSLNRIGRKTDISYGLYLYAWPIQLLLIKFLSIHQPWPLAVMALPLAALAGLISWKLVEKPFLRLKPNN